MIPLKPFSFHFDDLYARRADEGESRFRTLNIKGFKTGVLVRYSGASDPVRDGGWKFLNGDFRDDNPDTLVEQILDSAFRGTERPRADIEAQIQESLRAWIVDYRNATAMRTH